MLVNTSNTDQVPLMRAQGLALVLNTPKGRGVFATQNIPSNTIIDVCPVLPLPIEENESHVKHTILYNYTYNWPVRGQDGHTRTGQAVIFGLGSMFNHSTKAQNVGWTRDVDRSLITYIALEDIQPGDELCISYGDRLTFDDVDRQPLDQAEDDEPVALSNINL